MIDKFILTMILGELQRSGNSGECVVSWACGHCGFDVIVRKKDGTLLFCFQLHWEMLNELLSKRSVEATTAGKL